MSYTSRLFGNVEINKLAGIGPAIEKKLHHLNIFNIKNLLLHFPFRYEDRSHTSTIDLLVLGESVNVIGQITHVDIIQTHRKMLICTISDGTGQLQLRFLNVYAGMPAQFKEGSWIRVYGDIKAGQYCYEMLHPQFQISHDKNKINIATANAFTPIYHSTHGLSQTMLTKYITQARHMLLNHKCIELLPYYMANNLPSIEDAIHLIHSPPLTCDINSLMQGTHPAIQRFIIEELLASRLAIKILKHESAQHKAIPLKSTNKLIPKFKQSLPFSPTNAQQKVWKDIEMDLAQKAPMMRLVQGDVGSGKTLVAAFSTLACIENNRQVVIMAPTEILAEQHYHTFKQWFLSLSLNVELLTGKLTKSKKLALYHSLEHNQINLLIATHAALVEQVEFHSLGLVIIDEQHRFGVEQRLKLWEKGINNNSVPHQLVLTATPIPRTLSMTIYADLDISIIDELPPGRTPITTLLMPNRKRDDLIKRIFDTREEKKQIYWVCTLIEPSEKLSAESAELIYQDLCAKLPSISIGLIHGKLSATEKEQIMTQFKNREIMILVATTVIEVGVDVPNASLMVIENAERLGLSQLHQLRGRVGRGDIESFCFLLYQEPLSKIAQERLYTMKSSQDGFFIAEKDLELRGCGDILGTNQIGGMNFKIADLMRDQKLLMMVNKISDDFANEQSKALELIEFWLDDKQRFSNA